MSDRLCWYCFELYPPSLIIDLPDNDAICIVCLNRRTNVVDTDTLETYVKIGTELYPLVSMTVGSIIGLVKQNNGNAQVLDMLKANAALIAEDKQTLADEQKELDATAPPAQTPPVTPPTVPPTTSGS